MGSMKPSRSDPMHHGVVAASHLMDVVDDVGDQLDVVAIVVTVEALQPMPVEDDADRAVGLLDSPDRSPRSGSGRRRRSRERNCGTR